MGCNPEILLQEDRQANRALCAHNRLRSAEWFRHENRFERERVENELWRKMHPETTRWKSEEERDRRRRKEAIRSERKRRWVASHSMEYLMRSMVARMLKASDLSETCRSRQYIGCSPGFLRNHIEAQFKPGMSWANHGVWHVDHIVPLSWFPFKEDPSLLFVASHWTNLQPLWGRENLSKGNRYAGRPPSRGV